MGLLDSIKFSTGDPEKDAQLNRGLIAAGLQLMQARGRLFPAIGQAGMMGLQAADQTRQQQMQAQEQAQRRQMMGLQIGQAQREAELARLPQQFYKPGGVVGADGTDAGAGMGGGQQQESQFDMPGYIQKLMAMAPQQALQLKAMLQKPAVQPLVSKPGDVARDPNTGAVLWQNPQEAKPGDIPNDIQLYEYAKKQGFQGTFEQWDIARRRAAATNISNAPYAGVERVIDADGKVRLVQPGSRPGQAPQMVIDPTTGKPAEAAPSGGGAKVPAEIQRMNAAADTMATLLGDYEAWLKANNPRDAAVQMNPAMRAQAQARMKNIQLQFKELQALGALAGPDLALMEAALTDPFTWRGAMYGREGLMGQIGEARRLIDVRRKAMAAQSGTAPGGAASSPDTDPLGLRK